MEITYQGLRIRLPMEGMIQAEEFTLNASFNDHVSVQVSFLAEEEGLEASIHGIMDGAELIVEEEGILFRGKITKAEMVGERGLCMLKVTALSHTMDWSFQPVSRSFQNLDASYGQVMEKVLEDQPDAEIMDCVTGGAVIPDFLLQYEESDWEFLCRLASHFHSFLVPDCRSDHGRAYFGIPDDPEEFTLEEGAYCEVKDMDRYYHAGRSLDLLPQEHMYWTVRSRHALRLAQRVSFRGIRTLVTRVRYETRNGELLRIYDLGREKGTVSVPYKNPNIYGMSIPATVMERSGNCVRVHFHIDPEYDPSPGTRYFTYAIESSFIYCMPEVGSQVHIYFPGDNESDAIAVHAIRSEPAPGASPSGGGYARNPDNKSFSNVNGAELLMTPSGASISADQEQSACVRLDTEGNAWIEGDTVTIRAEKNLSIGESAEEGGDPAGLVYMEGKSVTFQIGEESSGSRIELEEEARIFVAFVKLNASDTSPADPPADEVFKRVTAGDEDARNDINGEAASQLVEKYEEGKQKVLGGMAKVLATVATVAVVVALTAATVATGGVAAALLGPTMLATYGTGAVAVGFGVAEIMEGTEDMEKSQSGDLSESFNFIRDTAFEAVFGDNKQAAYNFAKMLNDIAFGIVSGKAIGQAFQAAQNLGRIGKIACSSRELRRLQTVIHMGGNVLNSGMNELAATGTIDPMGMMLNLGIGVLQGQAGSRITDKIVGKIVNEKTGAAMVKTAKVITGTLVDTGLDGAVSGLLRREFDPLQSLAQNAFANSLSSYIADPVDASTGSYVLHTTDFILACIPSALKLERTYRSTCKEVSVLGKGWQFPYASRLYRDTQKEGRVHLYTITGHSVCFEAEDGRWINQSKGTSRFALETDENRNVHILTDVMEHTRCVYDSEGRLSYVEYPNRQRLTFFYTEDGLSRIVTPLNNVLEAESRKGRLLQITDEIGRRTQYRYAEDLLTDVVHTDEGITHYEYDENGSIRSVTDQNGVRYLENTYDSRGRIIRQEFENGVRQDFSYDDRNRRNTIIYSENGKTEVYEYNEALLTDRILYEDGTCTGYEYSEDNLRTKETGRTGAVTEWEYDAYGRLIRETAPDGYETYHTYDEAHDLVCDRDSEGRETLFQYDAEHNLLCRKEKTEDGQYRETHYTYDEKGRCTSIRDALGNVTLRQYDKNSAHPTCILTPKGEETSYGYDIVGRRMSIENAYGAVEMSYNSRNFVTSRIDGEGNESRWFYDRMGNLTDYCPAKQWKEQAGGYQYRYDFLERLVDTVTPLNEHHRQYRNFDGDIIRTIHPVSYAQKGEGGAGARYDYDKDGNCIRIHYADGGTERRFYDAEGRMLKQVMPESYDHKTDDGAGFTYRYDIRGRLIHVHDPEGNRLRSYEYNGRDQVIREIDGEGKETLLHYNGLGLKTREQVSVRKEGECTCYRVIAYRYDRQGNKVEEAYGQQEVERDADPVSWHKIRFSYDANNRLILVEDDFGARMRYAYDCLGSLTLEERTIEEGIVQKIRYGYNKNGWRISRTETIQGNGEKKLAVTRYGYDENGNRNWIRTPGGFEIRRSFDADDRLTEERVLDKKNGIDRRTCYTYDAAGNILSVSVYGAGPEEETQKKNLKISYQYDLKDRLTHQIRQNGAVTRYLYDQNDRLIKEISPYGYDRESDSGTGTSYRYDSRGNRIRVTNGLGQVVEERNYNLQDMPSMQRDGFGNETAYQYTLDGQIREAKRGKRGKKESSLYKVLQSYEYNARGQITGITDGNGERIDYRLDTWGRITGIAFSDGVTEGCEYTPSGQVSRTINGNGGSIQYRYNSFGKVRERIDQMGDAETFRYDEEGNLSLHIDRDGRQISRTYNVFGNLICEKAVDENGENPVITTCRYDSLGRLTHAVCNGHSYEYIYNGQGQLKEKRSGGRRLISYTYDRAGKITEITDPAGVTTHYEYDILGRTSRIFSTEGMEVRYRYDCLDRLEQIHYGNGIRTSYQYDADGNVSHLETRMGSDILLSFRYRYDGNGNRLSKTGTQGPATDGSSALEITYQYDVRGQLLEENRKDAVFRYNYDASGNRVQKEETGKNQKIRTKYSYNEKNQLINTEEIRTDGIRRRNTFTYSRQGSILKEETGSGTCRYFYNSKNQQIRIERADGQIQENRYDAEGLRHEMRENEKLLRFVYQNGELLYEEGGDKETAGYHLGAGIEAVRRGQRTYYYHSDEQLSTALITDETGTIKNQYRYDAFGAGLEVSEELPNRICYTGQQYDGVTEQYYLRARYYNPILGRFLQEDVYQGDGLNLYAYCRNNPVVYYDPSGYNEQPDKCGNTGKIGNTEENPQDQTNQQKSDTTVPKEPYNRRKHYGSTPTPKDREVVGGSPDHDPPLVQRYYEGDPSIGEKPGYLMTPEERRASANDRSRMRPSTQEAQRRQGAEMARYSKGMKKKYGL